MAVDVVVVVAAASVGTAAQDIGLLHTPLCEGCADEQWSSSSSSSPSPSGHTPQAAEEEEGSDDEDGDEDSPPRSRMLCLDIRSSLRRA